MSDPPVTAEVRPVPALPLKTVLREWGRIGCIGFGGPPTHIKLLRELCVQRKGWLAPAQRRRRPGGGRRGDRRGRAGVGRVERPVPQRGRPRPDHPRARGADRRGGRVRRRLGGGLLAAAVAFAPSFAFALVGGPRFGQIRGGRRARAFLDGAGPAAIGAILGSAITLTRALARPWQYAVLAAAYLIGQHSASLTS